MNDDVRKAVRDLAENARPVQQQPPYTEYIIPTGVLTVLTRVVLDGCTYEEARS